MKWRMQILLSMLMVLVFGLSACVNVSNNNGKEKEAPKNALPVEEDSGKGTEKEPEKVTAKDVLVEIQDLLMTDFEVELPTGVRVSTGKYLSATATSDSKKYEVSFYETDEPLELNDEKLEGKTPIAILKGTVYATVEAANEQIGYQAIQDNIPEVDLGYDITGYEDAGAGSSFIAWHEGRWSMIVRGLNDDTGNEARLNLSKAIVEET